MNPNDRMRLLPFLLVPAVTALLIALFTWPQARLEPREDRRIRRSVDLRWSGRTGENRRDHSYEADDDSAADAEQGDAKRPHVAAELADVLVNASEAGIHPPGEVVESFVGPDSSLHT
jgi:hypothetical protein